MKKIISFLFFLLWAIYQVDGQVTIEGLTYDRKTGTPLAYTNILVKGTTIGTMSNEAGRFRLRLPELPVTVVFRYIGYDEKEMLIESSTQNEMDVAMNPIVLQMESVSITADQEDPAVGIMRKVIARKQIWMQKLHSYRAKAYTRTRIENDTSIVSITESVSNLYWDTDLGTREEFLARHTGKQIPYLAESSPGSKEILNFYQDDLTLLAHRFVGPTHPRALKHYYFQLEDVRSIGEKAVFDIKVIPKSKLQPLFTGRISVLDGDFALIDVDLTNTGSFSFSPMLPYFRGHYRQQFSNFGSEFWLPIDSRVEEAMIVDMGILAFPKGKQRKISRISHYEINGDFKDAIERLDSLDAIHSQDQTISNNPVIFDEFAKVPWTEAEALVFNHPDTTLTLIKAFRPTGLMAPFFIRREYEIEKDLSETGSYMADPPIQSFGISIWLNRVEGLHLGVKMRRNLSDHFKIGISGGYQTARKNGFYDFHTDYLPQGKDGDVSFILGMSDLIDTRYPSNRYSRMAASLLQLTGREDYFDYFRNRSCRLGIQTDFQSIKSILEATVRFEKHVSLDKLTNWHLTGRGKQRINPAIDEGDLNVFHLNFTYDQAYGEYFMLRLFGPDTDVFKIDLDYSNPSVLGGNFKFTRLSALFDYKLDTFFRRRQYPNTLRVRFEGLKVWGNVPFQYFTAIDGTLMGYAPFGVFKSLPGRVLEGEEKFAAFWEYNFESVPFEILGLKGPASQQWEFLFHGAYGRTWIGANRLRAMNNNTSLSYRDDWHFELGMGISLKYRFLALRLDSVQNMVTKLKYLGFTVSLLGMSF